VNLPDPAWHFSGRSQSAAWTALNGPYRDAVLDDRSDEAAEIMATDIAPDFEYVGPRCQRALSSTDGGGVNLLEFEHDGEIWCSNGNLEEVSDPRRIDWLAWVDVVRGYEAEAWWQRFEFTDSEMFDGFDGIDRSIALDSGLHPPRIGERRRMLPSGRLLYGLVLEGMAPGQPTRFEFTDPEQGFEIERRADGWHVVQTVRVGGSVVVSAVDSPRGTLTLESPRQRSVPYRPRWARGLAATLAEIGAP
jgi:hypothetical protein